MQEHDFAHIDASEIQHFKEDWLIEGVMSENPEVKLSLDEGSVTIEAVEENGETKLLIQNES